MKGFTLLELTIVIIIIAAVSVLGISAIDRYDAATKQTQYCVIISNLTNSITSYITKYRTIPTATQLQQYIGGGELLVNPYTNHNIFLDYGATKLGGWNIDQYGNIQLTGSTVKCEVME